MGRILAIDFGLKRIGLAWSDERKKIAFPLPPIQGGPRAVDHLRQALGPKLQEVKEILLGWPLLLSGEEGDMTKQVRQFAEKLEQALHLPIRFIDERLSSKQAEKSLQFLSLSRRERAEQSDTAVACLLLQTYLDQLNQKEPHAP